MLKEYYTLVDFMDNTQYIHKTFQKEIYNNLYNTIVEEYNYIAFNVNYYKCAMYFANVFILQYNNYSFCKQYPNILDRVIKVIEKSGIFRIYYDDIEKFMLDNNIYFNFYLNEYVDNNYTYHYNYMLAKEILKLCEYYDIKIDIINNLDEIKR